MAHISMNRYYRRQPWQYAFFLILSLSLAVGAGTGCSKNDGPTKVMFTGKVTFKGQPFSNAAVRLYNPDLGGGLYELDSEGNFKSPFPLTTGKYSVCISSPPPKFSMPGAPDAKSPAGRLPKGTQVPAIPVPVAQKDRSKELPKKYLDFKGSGLAANLDASQDNHFVFDLDG